MILDKIFERTGLICDRYLADSSSSFTTERDDADEIPQRHHHSTTHDPSQPTSKIGAEHAVKEFESLISSGISSLKRHIKRFEISLLLLVFTLSILLVSFFLLSSFFFVLSSFFFLLLVSIFRPEWVAIMIHENIFNRILTSFVEGLHRKALLIEEGKLYNKSSSSSSTVSELSNKFTAGGNVDDGRGNRKKSNAIVGTSANSGASFHQNNLILQSLEEELKINDFGWERGTGMGRVAGGNIDILAGGNDHLISKPTAWIDLLRCCIRFRSYSAPLIIKQVNKVFPLDTSSFSSATIGGSSGNNGVTSPLLFTGGNPMSSSAPSGSFVASSAAAPDNAAILNRLFAFETTADPVAVASSSSSNNANSVTNSVAMSGVNPLARLGRRNCERGMTSPILEKVNENDKEEDSDKYSSTFQSPNQNFRDKIGKFPDQHEHLQQSIDFPPVSLATSFPNFNSFDAARDVVELRTLTSLPQPSSSRTREPIRPAQQNNTPSSFLKRAARAFATYLAGSSIFQRGTPASHFQTFSARTLGEDLAPRILTHSLAQTVATQSLAFPLPTAWRTVGAASLLFFQLPRARGAAPSVAPFQLPPFLDLNETSSLPGSFLPKRLSSEVIIQAPSQNSEERTLLQSEGGINFIRPSDPSQVRRRLQGPINDEFQISTLTTGNNQYPTVASLSGGGFVVTWQNDASRTEIYGRRYDNSAAAMGSDFQISTLTTGNNLYPSVAALSGGGFVVTWRNTNSLHTIYGRRYNSGAVAIGSVFQISTLTTGSNKNPTVAAFSGGGFVVTWHNDAAPNKIYGRRYDSSGTALGSEFQINTYTEDDQSPAVAALTGGEFVVTWYYTVSSPYRIYGRRYDSSGTALGSEFQINTLTMGHNVAPAVAALSGGGFVVTWHNEASPFKVYGRRYDSSATATGAEFQINTITTGNNWSPTVAALSGGRFVVTWWNGGSPYTIYGRLYDSSAAAIGSEFRINTITTGDNYYPNVAALNGGDYVVTWHNDNSLDQIYGRLFTSNAFPTSQPSAQPTTQPTTQPSLQPTTQPSGQPSQQPTIQPTSFISESLKLGLVAYWPFDGNARDQSGNGNNGVVHSPTLATDRLGMSNSAYSFNGINSYIEIVDGSPFDFSNNMSVAFWVKPETTQLDWAQILSKSHSSNSGSSWIIEQHGNSLNNYEFVYLQHPLHNWFYTTQKFTNAHQWHHYVISKENTKLSTYLNGSLAFIDYGTNPLIKQNGNLPLTIGAHNVASTQPANGLASYFNGLLDDIFIYNRPLSAEEVLSLYQFEAPTSQPSAQPSSYPSTQPSNQPTRQPTSLPSGQPSEQPSSQPSFQPTTQPTSFISGSLKGGLVAYYPFDGNARDRSGNGNNGEVHSATPATDRLGMPNSAYNFNGINSYIEVVNGGPFDFSNNMSLAFWMKPGASQNDHAMIFSKSESTNFVSSWIIEQAGSYLNNYRFAYHQHPLNSWLYLTPRLLNAHQWHHYILTKENNKLSTFLNGNLAGIEYGTTPLLKQNGNLPLTIGAINEAHTQPASGLRHYFNGSLDDIFIYNRPLSAQEALSLYQFEAPTGHPSTQPSSHPSTQPTGHPNGQPTSQPISRPSSQPTGQPADQPSNQPISQPSAQPSRQPAAWPTGQPTRRPSVFPSAWPTLIPTSLPTSQPSFFPSTQPTSQPSTQPSGQPSSQPTSQPSGQPSSQPSDDPTSEPTTQPSLIPSTKPTAGSTTQPSTLPSAFPSAQPSLHPTSKPTTSPSDQPTDQPSAQPTGQPTKQPLAWPTAEPTRQPSVFPSASPTLIPTRQPTLLPSTKPTSGPTSQPSLNPSSQPTGSPSVQPTSLPTTQPSSLPTAQPSEQPSSHPSSQSTGQPTSLPTIIPSSQPSDEPTSLPGSQPILNPSSQPTGLPSVQPTSLPTTQPSSLSSSQPSELLSSPLTTQPSSLLTFQPTRQPSEHPSSPPTSQPTSLPSIIPSGQPSGQPTSLPTSQPTTQPSFQPNSQPSALLSSLPSVQPSLSPSTQPTDQPSSLPTIQPSAQPSKCPTSGPTAQPSLIPSLAPNGRPTSQPIAPPTSHPSVQPSGTPFSQPSKKPSFSPSIQPTSFPTPKTKPRFTGWLALLGPESTIHHVTSLKEKGLLGLAKENSLFRFNASNGALLGKYSLPWKVTKAALSNPSPYNNLNLLGSGKKDSSSALANCALAEGALHCQEVSHSGIQYESALFHPYYYLPIALGRDALNRTITTFFNPSLASSATYSFTLPAILSLPVMASLSSAATTLLTGVRADVQQKSAIVAGLLNLTPSPNVGKMTLLTPQGNKTIRNDKGLVNAVTLLPGSLDSMMAGGMDLGQGLQPFLLRLSSSLEKIVCAKQFQVSGSFSDLFFSSNQLYALGSILSKKRDSTQSHLNIAPINLSNCEPLVASVQVSGPGNITCSHATPTPAGFSIACNLNQDQALLFSTDKKLTFTQLPAGFRSRFQSDFVYKDLNLTLTSLLKAPVKGNYFYPATTRGSFFLASDPFTQILPEEFAGYVPLPTLAPRIPPTLSPTASPTLYPTAIPTLLPSIQSPTPNPSEAPSLRPLISSYPTSSPSSSQPTRTCRPTPPPSFIPSRLPTSQPTPAPSLQPASFPTQSPSAFPSFLPTLTKTKSPTLHPSRLPSLRPTQRPSYPKTLKPTIPTSALPTLFPEGLNSSSSSAFSDKKDSNSDSFSHTFTKASFLAPFLGFAVLNAAAFVAIKKCLKTRQAARQVARQEAKSSLPEKQQNEEASINSWNLSDLSNEELSSSLPSEFQELGSSSDSLEEGSDSQEFRNSQDDSLSLSQTLGSGLNGTKLRLF
jgi:hypothetical protein